jgi:hypothetical protein
MTKLKALSVAMLLLCTVGCATTLRTPKSLVGDYPSTPPTDLKVGLVLSPELHNAEWKPSDAVRAPVGDNLCRNSEALARSLFTSVEVGLTAASLSGGPSQAVLIPRMVTMEQAAGMWAWSDSQFAMVYEWKMTDPQGNPVWIETIKAVGKGNSGNAFTALGNMEKQIAAMLEDLFRQSHAAMAASPEIKAFAEKQAGSVAPTGK